MKKPGQKKKTHTQKTRLTTVNMLLKKKKRTVVKFQVTETIHHMFVFSFFLFVFFDRTFLLTPGVVREILQVPSLWTGQLYGDECKKNSCYVVSDPVHRAGQPLV